MRALSYWVVRGLPALDAAAQAVLLVTLFPLETHRPYSQLLLLFLIVPLSQHLLRQFGVYDSHRMEGAGEAVRKVISTQIIAFLAVGTAAVLIDSGRDLRPLGTLFAASAALFASERILIYGVLRVFRRRGYDRRNVCILGSWDKAMEFATQFAEHPEWGLRVACVGVGVPGSRTFAKFSEPETPTDDFENLLRICVVDEVLISVRPEQLQAEQQAVRLYEKYGLQVRVILETDGADRYTARMENFHGAAAMAVAAAPRTETDLALKRVFDLTISLLMLIAVAPILFLIAVMVGLSSPGPILFRQTRTGMYGRRFQMLKFRTMIDGAEAMIRHSHRSITQGPIFKDPNDYRITPVGRFLRRFSLDELPQLLNVLTGDMSLVGPRPLPIYEADQITGESRRRFSVPAGITCLWQVAGRNDVAYEQWMQYDLQYVDKWSLWFDTILLLRTVPAVLRRKGAY